MDDETVLRLHTSLATLSAQIRVLADAEVARRAAAAGIPHQTARTAYEAEVLAVYEKLMLRVEMDDPGLAARMDAWRNVDGSLF